MVIGNSYQTEFIQAERIVNRSKGLGAGSAFRHVPCFPPLLGFTHALKTPESSPERRVVEHASELECLFEKTILLIVYTKREFDDVGRSSRSHMAMLVHVPKMGTPCPLFEKRGLRRTSFYQRKTAPNPETLGPCTSEGPRDAALEIIACLLPRCVGTIMPHGRDRNQLFG